MQRDLHFKRLDDGGFSCPIMSDNQGHWLFELKGFHLLIREGSYPLDSQSSKCRHATGMHEIFSACFMVVNEEVSARKLSADAVFTVSILENTALSYGFGRG